jgi:hypothetical protein
MPIPEFVDDLLSAQADAAKDIEKSFLKSVKVTVQETDWEQLERDLAAHANGDAVINGVKWEDFDPKERLKDLFSACLDIDGEYIGKVTGGAKFDYVDPRALEWIEKYGAEDVVDIDASTKQAIRSIVREGYETGITPRNQARQIREIVGLDERRAETLRKYSENLFSKGLSEERVWELVEKKGRALRNSRALTIAVNETSEASAQAGYWSTKSAVERGVLDPNEYEGYRIVTPDERLCSRCAPIAGEARQIPDGTYESTGSNTAKVHTCCRCCEGLRQMKKKQAVTKRASGQGRMNIVFDCQALKRKDGVLYVPTVPLVEGVYEQWGFRVLRSYEEFSQSSHWLHGVPIVVNHEEVNPEARRIGQLFDIQNKPDGLKTSAISRFYEIDCTQRELEALLSGQPHDGSLYWSCFLEEAKGEWVDPATGERKQYDYKEVGPYVFYEYSFVKQGVIGTNDGAGFNMQCKDCSHSSAPGGADMEIEEMRQAMEEANKPLMEKFAVLEQKYTALESKIQAMDQKAEADRTARVFEAFQAKLKPGYQDKAKELFESYQTDPAKWVLENADKFIQAREARGLQGRAITEGGAGGFNLEQERAKLKAEGKVI